MEKHKQNKQTTTKTAWDTGIIKNYNHKETPFFPLLDQQSAVFSNTIDKTAENHAQLDRKNANCASFLKGIFEVSYKIFNYYAFWPQNAILRIYICMHIHVHTCKDVHYSIVHQSQRPPNFPQRESIKYFIITPYNVIFTMLYKNLCPDVERCPNYVKGKSLQDST